MDLIGITIGFLKEGLIYSIVSFGVYITYKILDFPDMTVDGSFPLGMSITAVLLSNHIGIFTTMIISFVCGMICGIITGVINVKLGVRDLLSGIIVMTGLYSIELRVAGKANFPIFHVDTLFRNRFLTLHFGRINKPCVSLVILIIIVLVCKLLLDKYLETKNGYLLKSVGDNDIVVTSLAIDKGNIKILGLAIANGLAALAGSICAHDRALFDISVGTGTLVIAVANVIIGLQIMKRFDKLKPTTAIIFGAIIYRACISIAISLGLPAGDLKLITAVLLLIILGHVKKRVKK